MADSKFQGKLEDLPAYREFPRADGTKGRYHAEIFETATIRLREAPGARHIPEIYVGVIGRNPKRESLYLATESMIIGGRRYAHPTGIREVPIFEVDSYTVMDDKSTRTVHPITTDELRRKRKEFVPEKD
ncbi:MAG: hypothetical protein AABW73_02285 [Nanoarchaeota archaeon]